MRRSAEREPGQHLPPGVADLVVGGPQERDQEEHQHVAGDDAHHERRLGEAIVERNTQLGRVDMPPRAIARVPVDRAPHAARHEPEGPRSEQRAMSSAIATGKTAADQARIRSRSPARRRRGQSAERSAATAVPGPR